MLEPRVLAGRNPKYNIAGISAIAAKKKAIKISVFGEIG